MHRLSKSPNDVGCRKFPVAPVLWRAFWAAVFVVHLGALYAAFTCVSAIEAAGLGAIVTRCLALSLSVAFCGLKVLDVPFLRLKPGWRSAISAGVAIALLHVGVLDHTPDRQSTVLPSQVGVVLFVGAFVDARTIAASMRRQLSFLRRVVRAEKVHVHLNPYLQAVEACFEPFHSSYEPCLAVPRAPPTL